jgi:hypothetical protein
MERVNDASLAMHSSSLMYMYAWTYMTMCTKSSVPRAASNMSSAYHDV